MKRETKKKLVINKDGNIIKFMRCSKNRSKKYIYMINANIKKKIKAQINNLTLHIKDLGKNNNSNNNNTQFSRRMEITKIIVEINEI